MRDRTDIELDVKLKNDEAIMVEVHNHTSHSELGKNSLH